MVVACVLVCLEWIDIEIAWWQKVLHTVYPSINGAIHASLMCPLFDKLDRWIVGQSSDFMNFFNDNVLIIRNKINNVLPSTGIDLSSNRE